MKAFVSDRYGSPDVMELQEVDKPQLTEESALVRVRATSVNAFDWHMLRGKPYLARLGEGLRAPKTTILGPRCGRDRRGGRRERHAHQAR